uniref:Immunoglobulin heavy variable 4-1 n=1 Tax=Erpetoichthys calabaricus TaxID=27687 RepID=A0A8C4RD16_ERPCA
KVQLKILPFFLTVRPGSSLTLTCQISGYSLTDCNYATHWIRQLPGNALQWLSYINCHGSTGYASSVQGRFTTTKSSSSVSLEMRSMTAADSAVYYCARQPQCGDPQALGTTILWAGCKSITG